MQERNRASLQRAIRNLPEYHPDPGIWVLIEHELEDARQGDLLQAKIQQLPNYDPPSLIWENISATLDKEKQVKPASKVLKLTVRRAAAALALLVFGLGWYFSTTNRATMAIVYATERIGAPAPVPEWDADRTAFETVLQMASGALPENKDKINSLQEELQELDQAKMEIRLIIEQYGNDPAVIKKLSEIEYERTDVIKQMAALI